MIIAPIRILSFALILRGLAKIHIKQALLCHRESTVLTVLRLASHQFMCHLIHGTVKWLLLFAAIKSCLKQLAKKSSLVKVQVTDNDTPEVGIYRIKRFCASITFLQQPKLSIVEATSHANVLRYFSLFCMTWSIETKSNLLTQRPKQNK